MITQAAQRQDIERLDQQLQEVESRVMEQLTGEFKEAWSNMGGQIEGLAAVNKAQFEATNQLHAKLRNELSEQLRQLQEVDQNAKEQIQHGHAAECALQAQLQADRQAVVVATTLVQQLALDLTADKESRQASLSELRTELYGHLNKAAERVMKEIISMQESTTQRLSADSAVQDLVYAATSSLREEVLQEMAKIVEFVQTGRDSWER